MKTDDNQRYIYIQATREKVPVTQEQFDTYYRETSVYRRRQQRYGLCDCPKRHWFSCDTDCENCYYRIESYKVASLDAPRTENDHRNRPKPQYDEIPEDSQTLEELTSEIDQMQRLLHQVQALMPEAIQLGQMRLDGQSDTVIADTLGIPRTTLLYRLKKLRQALDTEMSEIF